MPSGASAEVVGMRTEVILEPRSHKRSNMNEKRIAAHSGTSSALLRAIARSSCALSTTRTARTCAPALLLLTGPPRCRHTEPQRAHLDAAHASDSLANTDAALEPLCRPPYAQTFWHSSSHVLGQVLELTFGCDLTIGPSLEEGFYYDCFLVRPRLKEHERHQQLGTHLAGLLPDNVAVAPGAPRWPTPPSASRASHHPP